MSTNNFSESTIAIRGGRSLDSHASSILFPLYQTGNFVHDAVGIDKGFSYSRVSNPTVDALEKAIAALEAADRCVVTVDIFRGGENRDIRAARQTRRKLGYDFIHQIGRRMGSGHTTLHLEQKHVKPSVC